MNSKSLIAILGVAGAALALPAAAQMRMPDMSAAYLGASVGQSEFKFDCAGADPCDRKGTAWRFFGGYQFHPNFAAELGYVDLGEGTFGTTKLEGTAWDLSALGSFPFGNAFSVYGRLGLYNGELKASDPAGNGKGSRSSITWGIGGQVDVTRNLSARIEWQRYNKMGGGDFNEKADVDLLNIGALWKFR